MKRILLASLSVVSLAGCVHAQPFTGPTGQRMVELRCNGAFNEMGDCYNKARDECGGNFQVVDQREGTAYVMDRTPRSESVTPVAQRTLVVACEAPAVASR